ncbi:MAG TPA: Ig-like domain-containing protein [Candidatus Eremiobacteraceae bacterium]
MKIAFLSLLAASMLASGCSAGALAGLVGIPKPTPTPQLIMTPSSLTMQTTGPTQTQTITASESGSTFFTAQSSDVTIATVTPVQNTTNAFSVSALAVGACTINVTDENGQTVHVKVTVSL